MSYQFTSPSIRIRDLTFGWGDKLILNEISMDIPRGKIIAFMGPSGVGKTTMLRLISGQLQPNSGTIEVEGQLVSAMDRHQLHDYRRHIGVLLQNGALFTDLTVFENVATPVREHSLLPEQLVRRLVLSKLHSVGLGGTEDLMPAELSGGMARRVALARAVVMDPAIVLYDEPMTGLDPIAMSTVRKLMRETNDTLGLTSIVITHNVEQMKHLVDYCYILVAGCIVGEGPPEQLCASEDPSVHQFMNGRVEGPIPFHYLSADSGWNLLGQGH